MVKQYDIVFVGNQAIDKKTCIDGKYINVIGGSAYNSFCSSKIFYSNLNTAYFAPVGLETKKSIMNQYNLNKNIEYDIIFNIDEKTEKCESKLVTCRNNLQWQCKHLHISLRRDVDADSFLSGYVRYKTLSIDVTQASVKKYKIIIENIKDKIDFLFCDVQEYQYLNNINIKGTFIVTNEDRPVCLQDKKFTKMYAVPKISKPIKSITGAGDSFIGAFLSELAGQNDVEKSIAAGIAAGQVCLSVYGNENLDNKYFKRLSELYKKYVLTMPDRIIVIGPSCAGKTTIINNYFNLYDFYTRFDDLEVLRERVNYDNGEISPGEEMIYHSHGELLKRATIKYDDKSFKIIDCNLWKDVMQRLGNKLVDYSLIEFSRGSRKEYVDAIKLVFDKKKDYLIIFVNARYEVRFKRNLKRRFDGAHFVELDTFKSIYKHSCAEYFEKELLISGKKIPIINISNEECYSNLNMEKLFFTRKCY